MGLLNEKELLQLYGALDSKDLLKDNLKKLFGVKIVEIDGSQVKKIGEIELSKENIII